MADSLPDKVEDIVEELEQPLEPKLQAEAEADSARFDSLPWYKQLWENGFRIHDPKVNYPKIPRFLLAVYDWGDATFNHYDPSYVLGSGRNWKVMANNYNWMESYMLMFSPHMSQLMHLRSDIYNDVGVHLSFMAVSVGYTAKLNDLLGGAKNSRHTFNFNFTCSRFSFNYDYTSTDGNTRITHFGDYNNGHISMPFDDISHRSYAGELYYFFNHLKYSQAAAYSFSKYQLKSAGTPVLGLAVTHERIEMDFSSLPQDMKDYLPSIENLYRFRYTDYGILAGYAYNWVLYPRRWLFNITTLPSIGYRHNFRRATETKKDMLAANLRVKFGLVYNHKALFAALTGRFDGNFYFNSKYVFFNSIESLSLTVGARF